MEEKELDKHMREQKKEEKKAEKKHMKLEKAVQMEELSLIHI